MIAASPDEGLKFSVTGGQVSDIKAGLEFIENMDFLKNHEYLAMDKEYSAYVTLELCQKKGIIAVLPPFKHQWKYHKWIYAYHNEIEHLCGRIKHLRKIATRFKKLLRKFQDFVSIALIFRFLKTYVNTA
jgi:hypothetical protein